MGRWEASERTTRQQMLFKVIYNNQTQAVTEATELKDGKEHLAKFSKERNSSGYKSTLKFQSCTDRQTPPLA